MNPDLPHRCLACYEPLAEKETEFHHACSRRIFGTSEPPIIPYALGELQELAREVIQSSTSVPGVQAKLSLGLHSAAGRKKRRRFTIVGLWGNYVLKPPSDEFPSLPENEDLTLHLAELLKIRTVPHSLIRLASGELAYICRRVDRENNAKLAMEDLCQLSERLTEDKYKGSLEQVGKVVGKFSDQAGFDLQELFQVILFSFLIGNGDMHLKNFSLLRGRDGKIALAPAYDLLSTSIALPSDPEESALTLNGKKRKLNRDDFLQLARILGLRDVVVSRLLEFFSDRLDELESFVTKGFLSESLKGQYLQILLERRSRLQL